MYSPNDNAWNGHGTAVFDGHLLFPRQNRQAHRTRSTPSDSWLCLRSSSSTCCKTGVQTHATIDEEAYAIDVICLVGR